MEKLEEKKMKWDIRHTAVKAISVVVAIMVAIFTCSKEIYIFAEEHIIDSKTKIASCELSQEMHIGERLNKYAITIEPPYEMGRISVQAYITVSYDGNEQVILLEELFINPVYYNEVISYNEDDDRTVKVFPLLKRDLDEQISSFLKEKLEERMIQKGMDINLLSVEKNAILCIYCDDVKVPTYYLFNDGTPEEESRNDALDRVNSEIAVYNVNVMFVREGDLLKIVDEIMKLL